MTVPFATLFSPGQMVATPGALALLKRLGLSPESFLRRHLGGDWGDLDSEDWQANEDALCYGDRLLSSYRLDGTNRLWIVTEASRSVTTLLLPEEY